MASIKVKFRPSTSEGQEGSIYYQVLHDRKPRQINTSYRIFPEEWDERRGQVIAPKDSTRTAHILSIRERIRWDVDRLSRINRCLDTKGVAYTADDIVQEFHRYRDEYSLFNYMEKIIVRQKQNGKLRTSETYASALNSFRKFRKDEDIMLDSITSEVIQAYESWLKGNGLVPNTISFYTRIFRAIYNRAVDEEVIEDRHPFRKVYTGVDKTVKRALPLPVIKKIKALDLSLHPELDFARDMFMMSFYMRGMSFIDMCYLRKNDLKDGHVSYRRRKTGQQLTIEWTAEMQNILDKYPENTSDYLFPIIRNKEASERSVYRNVGYNINHSLKKVANMIGLNFNLTMYAARHSWASAAKAKGIPISVISEGMGHDSEQTTLIYLASLDTSVVDKANSIIMKALK